jgi:hypothetical protein
MRLHAKLTDYAKGELDYKEFFSAVWKARRMENEQKYNLLLFSS